MATLIPALSACVARMTSGERRLAERLEAKLDADYLLWFDVPVGPRQSHPDFVVLHPRRGLLVLEVKDWRLATIARADKSTWDILPGGEPKTVDNPAEQARHYALQVVDALKRDPQLVHADGRHQGKLRFPWSHGVVLSHITRKQFTDAGLDQAIAPHRVVCSDEMTEGVDPEEFQSRLWDMFPYDMLGGVLSLPQIDRVRWILFPEVRVPTQAGLFDTENTADDDADLPGIMRVMDIQQEQLARSLGDGHRVIHGVAGSGKTMILGYRAEYLARAATEGKPVLVLCYNEPLAGKLAAAMEAKGIADRVHARHFHKWCRDQLLAYGQSLPQDGTGFSDELVDKLIRAVDRKQIPAGQYRAILIDEGHDFKPAWFKLVTQMVDPLTNSLLVLYDDAQNIYERATSRDDRKQFSFKSVGIQAQGRTTVLKINYRNTQQILQTASLIAAELLSAQDMDDDGIPLVRPVSCGREGPAPQIIRLPSLRDEASAIADQLSAAHQEGHAWGDMAVFCRHHWMLDELARPLKMRQLPYQVRRGTGTGNFNPRADSIKLMTMHASKGLEFAVVALPGIGQMPMRSADERSEARLFYVAATRATHRLVVTVSGQGGFGQRLAPADLQSF
ncbi:MAG: 3'-5' exonuclease [Rhodoferax sp.]|uniref:DEAD/DEAH box helicase n=1 Tax=Rhodoferax sp. TaxID=50421 RepID=UPI003264C5FA